MKAVPLALSLILLLENVDGVTEPVQRHTHTCSMNTHTLKGTHIPTTEANLDVRELFKQNTLTHILYVKHLSMCIR